MRPPSGAYSPSGEFAEISDGPVRAGIALIWVAYHRRGQGVGAALVRAAAHHAGTVITDMSWSVPFTESGRALAAKINPDGSWLA
ncbi:GNAT family protein [Streptosporangium sandarakinum]